MPHEKITSAKNPKVKRVVALRDSKGRRKTNLTIIEGCREISQALASGVKVEELFIPDNLKLKEARQIQKQCESSGAGIYTLSADIFKKISYGDRNEEVLALAAIPTKALKDVQFSGEALLLIVEGVEKPGNLGAILRTADAAGVDAVLVCDGKTDIYNPNVTRASLGTVFSLNVIALTSEEALEFCRLQGIKVLTTSPSAETNYTKADMKGPLALVVGSEDKGVGSFWSEHADMKIRIPMNGKADSLNVSASTAIVIYEALRQRE